MTDAGEPSELRVIVGEALDALGRFDADRLERLAISCESWRSEPGRVGLDRGLSDTGIRGSADIRLFGRLLETTKANLSLICHPRLMSTVQLEYVPSAGHLGCGTRD
jgi:hypothetical protein